MNIRKAKLKAQTMKWTSLLPAKVACGADLDLQLLGMTFKFPSNTHQTTKNPALEGLDLCQIWQTQAMNISVKKHAHQRIVHGVTQTFQDLESQVLNSHCQDLGTCSSKVKQFKTWHAKSWNSVRFQTCGCQVLTNMFTCVHVLEDQVMKDIILGKGLMFEILYPKKFQDLESQVLNSAIIVKTWGHGIAKKCNISKLGIPSPEKKDFRTWSAKSWKIFPNVFMSWKAKSWKTKFLARV